MSEIRGSVEAGYEPVREAFERNFVENGDIGAGFCLYVDGAKVVDLTGGVRDTDGTAYDDTTLQLVFSSTKGVTATCAHLLAQRGELDLDAPVADYWPEFSAAGKADIPVRWLLSHQAGLVDVDRAMTVEEALDWTTICDALADSPPLWEPGTGYGYHAVTYGWLVGEVVRRVAGVDFGEFVRREISEPLGLDLWVGLPDGEQHRVSPLINSGMPGLPAAEPAGDADSQTDAPSLVGMLDMLLGEGNLLGRALTAPGGAFADDQVWNEARVRSAQIPAANGVTNAASLARMYAALVSEVDGVRLLDADTLERAIAPQVSGPSTVPLLDIPFALGFMTHSPLSPLLDGRSFGHYGAGGSLGFADPDRRVAGAYVMNAAQLAIAGDARTLGLLAAVDQVVN
ncbi:MAG TPA: serine hydrolase domain-containing protein [Microthrixaceae bacterium]|nr:beta-lactamase family protein [Microthrixaceae bacterium]MCB9374874.1 beta-lactamase family protein [Microthrixaceae bacterium]MCB9400927.1 beta-lactamase family protein [Microthrixaceae bacterium]MCO5304958.1 beta-lactamase family protein [Microthrixaceae bacterium]HMX08180.1 serine hydrolase domain-containing protein [Microthrixaceae bacterium]